MVTAGNNTNDEDRRHPAKRRLTTFDELNATVEHLTATNKDLEATLRELVEACEGGGTDRYLRALGSARLLLERMERASADAVRSRTRD